MKKKYYQVKNSHDLARGFLLSGLVFVCCGLVLTPRGWFSRRGGHTSDGGHVLKPPGKFHLNFFCPFHENTPKKEPFSVDFFFFLWYNKSIKIIKTMDKHSERGWINGKT